MAGEGTEPSLAQVMNQNSWHTVTGKMLILKRAINLLAADVTKEERKDAENLIPAGPAVQNLLTRLPPQLICEQLILARSELVSLLWIYLSNPEA